MKSHQKGWGDNYLMDSSLQKLVKHAREVFTAKGIGYTPKELASTLNQDGVACSPEQAMMAIQVLVNEDAIGPKNGHIFASLSARNH